MGYSGTGSPNKKATWIPTVIRICVVAPRGPFSSVGASSLMKLGTRTENDPEATPYMNLPMIIAISFSTRVMPAPTSTQAFARSRQFFFPYLVKRLIEIAPVADPREHIEVINDDLKSC